MQQPSDLRTKFGHLKYYHANKLLNLSLQKEAILSGRLDSIRNQTLQTIRKAYHRILLNPKTKMNQMCQ